MRSNVFRVTKDVEFYIYGAGEIGRDCTDNLLRAGFKVSRFIDRNAEHITPFSTIPIVRIESIRESEIGSNTIVFVAHHNAMIHYDITKKLYAQGFKNIIYLPSVENFNRMIESAMLYNYTCVIENRLDDINDCFCYDYLLTQRNSFSPIISQGDFNTIVWCPIEILYVGKNKENCDNSKVDKNGDQIFVALKSYVELFQFFEHGKGSYHRYLEERTHLNNTFPEEDKKIIADRYRLYQMYKRKFYSGLDYFIDTAIPVEWNPVGYFNVIDGHHRLVFLYLQNLKYIPVKMANNDYEMWYNKDCFDTMVTEVNREDWYNASPVFHPEFHLMIKQNESVHKSKTMLLLEWFEGNFFQGKKILDISGEYGHYARIAVNSKAQDITVVDDDFTQIHKIKWLNKLSYKEQINVIEDSIGAFLKDNMSIFDVIFAMGAINKTALDDTTYQEIVKRISCYTKIVIWEFSGNIESEKEALLMHPEFNNYHTIGSYFNGTEMIEIGVFYLNNSFIE